MMSKNLDPHILLPVIYTVFPTYGREHILHLRWYRTFLGVQFTLAVLDDLVSSESRTKFFPETILKQRHLDRLHISVFPLEGPIHVFHGVHCNFFDDGADLCNFLIESLSLLGSVETISFNGLSAP